MIYPQKSGAMKFFNFIGNTFLQHYSVFYLKEKLLTLYVALKFFIKRIG